MLSVALTLLEEETCKNCGTPAWIGHSTDNTIVFDVKSSVCYGCAELEKDREEQEKNRAVKTRGEARYVEPYNVWGDPLPGRSESYAREGD